MATVQTQLYQQPKEELISGSEAIGIACALADVCLLYTSPSPRDRG